MPAKLGSSWEERVRFSLHPLNPPPCQNKVRASYEIEPGRCGYQVVVAQGHVVVSSFEVGAANNAGPTTCTSFRAFRRAVGGPSARCKGQAHH